jgi:hypothetical protein
MRGTTSGSLEGSSSPRLANSAIARQPPCQELSVAPSVKACVCVCVCVCVCTHRAVAMANVRRLGQRQKRRQHLRVCVRVCVHVCVRVFCVSRACVCTHMLRHVCGRE